MDLSFTRFDRDNAVGAMPVELAVLMVGIASRQASSATAHVAMRIGTAMRSRRATQFRGPAFNPEMAARLDGWEGMNDPFT